MNRWLPTPTGLVGKRDSEDAGLLRDPLNERFEPLCSSFLKGGRRLPQRELRDVEIVGCIPETHHAGGEAMHTFAGTPANPPFQLFSQTSCAMIHLGYPNDTTTD